MLYLYYQTLKKDRGIFRQNVDRVFSKKGYGTVVTGTVNSGKLKVGEKVEFVIELGAGKVLSGLAKRVDRNLDTISLSNPNDIDILLKKI